MYLVVRKSTNQILLSSARPLDPAQYDEAEMRLVEIPDSEYVPEMVGGILESHD